MTDKRIQVAWIDPGGTTGFGAIICDPDWLSGSGKATWNGMKGSIDSFCCEFSEDGKGEDHVIDQTVSCLLSWEDAVYGIEDFIIGKHNRSRDFLSPVRITAAVRFAIRHEDGRRPYFQSPSEAKGSCTDDRMKQAGLYRSGQPHATDALRHCALFLRKARSDSEKRETIWPGEFV